MNEMIERVVKTLREIDFSTGVPNNYQVAREIIKAMREPTEAMLIRGRDRPFADADLNTNYCWHNMIDAILEGKA